MDIKNILAELKWLSSKEQLEEFHKKYLSKKGLISQEFKKVKDLSPEEKKSFWPKMSALKKWIESAYNDVIQKIEINEINEQLSQEIVDHTVDINITQWNFSLLANVRREVEEICRSFGFIIEYGNEVVTKFENFESVNIPLTHPATEMHDTIYLNEKDNNWEEFVLRTHTSSMQNLLIKKHWLPIKAVIPSKVYRYEDIDATHDTMFYQLEWLYIDKNVSIAHFKDMITKLLSAILHSEVEIRMRPWYFPFVEPGFEIDARYNIYNQKTEKKELSDWIEILWAGMVHPNVLKAANVDPKERQWFAFGIGINRVAAIRYGIKDIRYFTNWDLRFTKSFD